MLVETFIDKSKWKMVYGEFQEIDIHRGPAGSYKNLHKPLPPPPDNQRWIFDDAAREWRLEDVSHDVEAHGDLVYEIPDEMPRFIEHSIQEGTDTLAGLCLRYKVTSTELRQANGGFSGENLTLAPNPLLIPKKPNVDYGSDVLDIAVHVDPWPTQETLLNQFLKSYHPKGIGHELEARAYLELNDWDLGLALKNAKEDGFLEPDNCQCVVS